jgi:hypothetical protein
VDRSSLAKRWGASLKTLDRLKAEGLVARRARRADGKTVLAYMPGVVAACGRAREERPGTPARPTRLTAEERRRAVRAAARLRGIFGVSLHQAAVRLAARLERSVETIRQVLRGEEERRARSGEARVFGGAGPVRKDERRWMERAWRRGAEPSDLARHARCGRPAVQRAINMVRHERLMNLAAQGSLTPAFPGPWSAPGKDLPAPSDHPLLKSPLVRGDLGRPGVTDLAYLLESARVRTVVSPKDERAVLTAYHALRALARAWAAATPRLNPQSEPLDRAETALRWAARLKAELVRPLWPLMIETAGAVLGRPLESLAPARLADLLGTLLAVSASAVDHTDPAGTGRVAGAAALDLSTAAARWVKANAAGPAGKGAARVLPTGIEVADWTRELAPWQAWLEPDRRIRPILSRLTPRHAEVLVRRMGWGGDRPLTQTEAAAALRVARLALPRLERAAVREALARVRP